MTWRGKYCVDARLPFGLRSTPKIFNAVADALEWCYRWEGVSHLDHYLDDLFTMGPPSSNICRLSMSRQQGWESLWQRRRPRAPLHPLCSWAFRSIRWMGTLSLPHEKLDRIQRKLQSWSQRKWCRRRELESLIGLLHHAARVVRPGRSFLHRLISLLCGERLNDHFIRLIKEAFADVYWWLTFMKLWNGISIFSTGGPTIQLVSDASGSWGCGAFSGHEWF